MGAGLEDAAGDEYMSGQGLGGILLREKPRRHDDAVTHPHLLPHTHYSLNLSNQLWF